MVLRRSEPLISELAAAIEDDVLGGVLAYNVMDGRIYVTAATPWSEAVTGGSLRPWSTLDDSFGYAYVQEKFGCSIERNFQHALAMASSSHSFDPVKQMFDSLPQWDGVQRVGNMFHWYLGAPNDDYTSQVEYLLYRAAIARVYTPGVKYDHMVVLKGAQGIGKSTWCQRFAVEPAFFTDSLTGIGKKEGAELIQGKWVVEISELAAMRNSQIEIIKAFITRQSDDFRSPYARHVEDRPRRCVLLGSTNAAAFLTDSTGNRRFLPIECGAVKRERDLSEASSMAEFKRAWSEALAYAKVDGLDNPPKLVLPETVIQAARDAQEGSTIEDPRIGLVGSYLDAKAVGEYVCGIEVIECALGVSPSLQTRTEQMQVSEIIRTHFPNWQQRGVKPIEGYGRQRCFQRIK